MIVNFAQMIAGVSDSNQNLIIAGYKHKYIYIPRSELVKYYKHST